MPEERFTLTLSLPKVAEHALALSAKMAGLSTEEFAEELLRDGFLRYLKGRRLMQTLSDLLEESGIHLFVVEKDAATDATEETDTK